MSSDDMHQLIRAEMANVLNEIAHAQNHRGAIGASPLDAFAGDMAAHGDRLQLLRDRVSMLEDALAKSEADRAATYLKVEQANRQLQAANEEKLAMIHEYHDAHHGPIAEATMLLNAAQEDSQRLRHQLTLLSEKYDSEVPRLRSLVRDQEMELKRLRKVCKQSSTQLAARDRSDDRSAVTLADLQYSNERLSAQLAKLQAPPPAPVFDEAKFRELEQAVLSVTSEMSALEQKMARMKTMHEAEKRELLFTLETQQREFAAEREECDKVVQLMAAKLESLLEENNLLRGVGMTATSAAASVSGTSTPAAQIRRTPSKMGR